LRRPERRPRGDAEEVSEAEFVAEQIDVDDQEGSGSVSGCCRRGLCAGGDPERLGYWDFAAIEPRSAGSVEVTEGVSTI
jgi:hypothetical protein